jgi:hypothetical protein
VIEIETPVHSGQGMGFNWPNCRIDPEKAKDDDQITLTERRKIIPGQP